MHHLPISRQQYHGAWVPIAQALLGNRLATPPPIPLASGLEYFYG